MRGIRKFSLLMQVNNPATVATAKVFLALYLSGFPIGISDRSNEMMPASSLI